MYELELTAQPQYYLIGPRAARLPQQANALRALDDRNERPHCINVFIRWLEAWRALKENRACPECTGALESQIPRSKSRGVDAKAACFRSILLVEATPEPPICPAGSPVRDDLPRFHRKLESIRRLLPPFPDSLERRRIIERLLHLDDLKLPEVRRRANRESAHPELHRHAGS